MKRKTSIITILSIISMLFISTSAFAVIQNYPSDYTSCYMLYYDYYPDMFCNASHTPDSPAVRTEQTNLAKALFQKAYYTTSDPRYTNMWGTYSSSQHGAHEGLDMVKGTTGQPIYHWGITGTVIAKNTTTGMVAIYCSGLGRTIFYRHLDTISGSVYLNATVTSDQLIGTQGERGNADGVHLHSGVESGSDTSDSPGDDSDFTSANIYETMDWVLHG